MDFLTFTCMYLSATAVLLFVLLFGENPLFRNTPVGYFRWLVTTGVWEGSEWVVWKCCGNKGLSYMNSAEECCCDRPNPTLQIFYVTLLSVGYYAYWEFIFKLLPSSPTASEHHMWWGTCVACTCLSLFVAASASDPGTVTAANAGKHKALYPVDGFLWHEVDCWTCNFPRPARSKHCKVCARCVARFDHHCGWINNCVGLNNMRLFFGFLVANVVLCVYGSMLAALVLYGEMQKYGLLQLSVWDNKAGRLSPMRANAKAQWLLHYYPAACMLWLFLMVAGLLLVSFSSYHLYLLLNGVTMYETFRRQRLLAELAEQVVEAPVSPPCGWRARLLHFLCCNTGQRTAARPSMVPANPYNRGVFRNLLEVLRPAASLEAAWAASAKVKEQ